VPDIDEIRAAHARISPVVRRTPVLAARSLDALLGARLFFKCENFQATGSFKARGAANAVLGLDAGAMPRAVVTHSSGNHAAALAWAARLRGLEAHVVMPETASAPKVAAARAYGALIHFCAPTLAARDAMAAELVARTGGAFVPPFDSRAVIAGQGTVAIELIEDAGEDLAAITCPVGGGGLLAGSAIAARALVPGMTIVAAEPEAADDAARGFATGRLQPQVLPVTTIADGLATAMCARTFSVMRDRVDAVVTVSEAAIIEAMRLVWSRMKVLIEPSCAVPVAALLENRWHPDGPVGVILTGGNVDLDRLPWA
jgi:threonine dehydratase